MKKKALAIIVMFLCFAGVVSASSINGDYKGNPIVKITSNGKVLEVDEVPPMIYDGHTLVPISLLRQLGASVIWDADTYSVDVNIPKSSTTISDLRAKVTKNNVRMANLYKLNEDMSERIASYSNIMSLYFSGHNMNLTSTITDKYLNDKLAEVIDNYNFISDTFNKNKDSLPGIDLNDLNNSITNNYQSIEYYKKATTDIINWNYYRVIKDLYNSQISFDSYLNNSQSGFTFYNQSISNSSIGYDTYILKVINN